MGCTFILGVVDASKYNVTDDLQQKAGWLNGVGDYGIQASSYRWVYQ